jgi:hypothetical protein
VTNKTTFRLEFLPLEVDEPFEVQIHGIVVPGQPALMRLIHLKPGMVMRPGFRLPY